MPKFLQSGALFALTLLLAPLAARADEVMFRGQKIEFGAGGLVERASRPFGQRSCGTGVSPVQLVADRAAFLL